MIALGDKDISNLMLGNTQVTKVMLGEKQVYPFSTQIDDNNYKSLVFIANAPSTIGLAELSYYQTLEYSLDEQLWNTFGKKTSINLDSGEKLYVRGKLTENNNSVIYTQFSIEGNVSVDGDCRYIWDYENPEAPLKEYCGNRLFNNCIGLTSVSNNILSSTELVEGCYYLMFNNCTNLINTPKLPATELKDYCYNGMFYGCSALIEVTELPATTLAPYCYNEMFRECISLQQTPYLCATQLADYCYTNMFYKCSNIKKVTELPATTLAANCYKQMFYGCILLQKAPELPAKTLVASCYSWMFYGCYSLNYIKCMAEDNLQNTSAWARNVSSTGIFVKSKNANNWTTGISGIPSGWEIIDADD